MKGGGLLALYSDDRDPRWRTELQHELEATPGGAGLVIAACQQASREFDARILGASFKAA